MERIGIIITLVLAATALVLPTDSLRAQDSQHLVRDQRVFDIHYRHNNHDFDPSYQGNGDIVARFAAVVDSIGADRIQRVEIRSTSSPEGSFAINEYLTNYRARDMRFLIFKNFPDIFPKIFNIREVESWDELRKYVEKDQYMSPASIQKILKVLDDENITLERRKYLMSHGLGTDVHVGNIYDYLYKTYYPIIRNSSISIVYLRDERVPALPPVASITTKAFAQNNPGLAKVELPVYEFPEPEVVEKVRPPKETIFALKTNLLYDAVTMVNAELEIPFAKRLSLMVEDVFPWWEFSKNKYALQNWEIGFEPRFWLRPWGPDKDKMLGHFFGVYGMSGRGDLQIVDKPNYQVHYWSAGLTYGYVLPLGRSHWGHLEFSLSGGYLRSDYQHYMPTDTYDKLVKDPYKSGIFNWWGPTKAKISLVIPINVKTQRAVEYANTKEGR